jgi:hypothetical protein
LNGQEHHSLKEILETVEKAVGRQNVGLTRNLGLVDILDEFFVGISHEKNFRNLAEFFESSKINLKENDFFSKFDLKETAKFSEFYKNNKPTETELAFPAISNYKNVSLD